MKHSGWTQQREPKGWWSILGGLNNEYRRDGGERWRHPAPRTSIGAPAWGRDEEVPLPGGFLSACRLCWRHASHHATREVEARAGEAGVEDNEAAEGYRGRGCFGGLGRIVYRHCFDTPSTPYRRRIGVGHGVRHRHVTSAEYRCNRVPD